MTPIMVSEQEMRLDAKTKIADKPARLRERAIGLEAKEGNSTRYRVEYTGLYCRREPADFWFSCEPYVIFTMKQGDSQWTRRKGPYEDCDSGDHYADHLTLRSNTPFGNDLYVVATLFEHDLGNIEEIEDAIQSTVDTLAGIVDNWWEVPDWLKDIVTDALTWFADLFGLDDDQIGNPSRSASPGAMPRAIQVPTTGKEFPTILISAVLAIWTAPGGSAVTSRSSLMFGRWIDQGREAVSRLAMGHGGPVACLPALAKPERSIADLPHHRAQRSNPVSGLPA